MSDLYQYTECRRGCSLCFILYGWDKKLETVKRIGENRQHQLKKKLEWSKSWGLKDFCENWLISEEQRGLSLAQGQFWLAKQNWNTTRPLFTCELRLLSPHGQSSSCHRNTWSLMCKRPFSDPLSDPLSETLLISYKRLKKVTPLPSDPELRLLKWDISPCCIVRCVSHIWRNDVACTSWPRAESPLSLIHRPTLKMHL